MWPLVEELVRDALGPGGEGLVLEGSGVWPDLVAGLLSDRVAAVWLTAARCACCGTGSTPSSGVDERSADERRAMRKFLGRTRAVPGPDAAGRRPAGAGHVDVERPPRTSTISSPGSGG